jgi:hypothetical protein
MVRGDVIGRFCLFVMRCVANCSDFTLSYDLYPCFFCFPPFVAAVPCTYPGFWQ